MMFHSRSSDPRDGGEPPTAKADARLLMHKMQVPVVCKDAQNCFDSMGT